MFYDVEKKSSPSLHYYNDIQYCIHEENLLLCNNCSLVFAEITFPHQFYLDILTNFHDQSDPCNPEKYDENLLNVDKKWALDKHNARTAFLKNASEPPNHRQKVLEVSSYRGWGLNESKTEWDVYGIEAHQQSVEFSRRTFPDLSHRTHYNLFELSGEFLSKNKYFDVVLLSACFRHMRDPFESLAILQKIVRENGYVVVDEMLFLDTIISEYIQGKTDNRDLKKVFSHGKSFYYSKNHIRRLFSLHGFEFIEYQKYESKNTKPIELDLMLFRRNPKIQPETFTREFNSFPTIEGAYNEGVYEFKRFFLSL
jgi:SAM-dependent methyltransferase